MVKTGDVILDEWQREILKHEGDVLLCTGRQVGKSTIFSIKAAEYLVKHANSTIINVSITEDQAKLILVMVLDYLEKHHKGKIRKGKLRTNTRKITLRNGSVMIARPVGQTGDSIRGFTGDVLYVDEAAKMPSLVWEAAKPVLLTTAGQIWMSSTPCGKQGYFWESFNNKDSRFKVWHKSCVDVTEERPLTKTWTIGQRAGAIRHLEQEKQDMSELQFGQEYCGLFLDDLRRYFTDEIIDKACVLERPVPSPKDNNFLGVDIARLGGDECSYEVIHVKENGYMKHIFHQAQKEQLTTQTERDILNHSEVFQCKAVGIDAGSGSLGVGIFDRLLENPKTRKKVVSMNNRQISLDRYGERRQRIFKEDMYDNMLSLMETGKLTLLDDEAIRLSLRSIQWELTEGQDTKVHIFSSYGHIVEGLIRAVWLAKKHKVNKLQIHSM